MYTYGQPVYLAKIIVKRSYDSWTGPHNKTLEEQIEEVKPKLKGYYVPNLYLGNNNIFNVNRTHNGIDFAVKKLIAACFIDYMVVKTALKYPIEEPKIHYIRDDIDELLFGRIPNNEFVTKYIKNTWEPCHAIIIKNMRDKVINEWEGKGPCEEVRKFFETGYYYLERNTKYRWIEGKTAHELAHIMVSNNIIEIDGCMKSALKHRHLSVKALQRALNCELCNLTLGERNDLRSRYLCDKWISGLTFKQVEAINGMLGMDESILQCTLIRAYGLDLLVNIDTVREMIPERLKLGEYAK